MRRFGTIQPTFQLGWVSVGAVPASETRVLISPTQGTAPSLCRYPLLGSESVQPLTLREVGGEGTAETSRDLRIFLGFELVVQPEPEPECGSLCPACYSEVLCIPLAHPRLPASGSRPREDCRRTLRQALSQEESWLKSEHLDFEEVWLF